jgi:serine protease Do
MRHTGVPARSKIMTAIGGDRRTLRIVNFIMFLAAALMLLASTAQSRAAPESFADLAEKLLPAVVNISTSSVVKGHGGPNLPQFPQGSPFEDFFRDFFDKNRPDQPRRATSLGSGFIIDKSGIVVTNNHVIADADQITVVLQDDTKLEAKLIGRDPKTDLAVLKVESPTDLPVAPFGDSEKLRVGDWVMAIGNPFGLGGTVTAGIVSARGRDIESGPYDNFIQTDASINRGNSGGPLFNMAGEVVGINTAIFSQTGGSVGIGFSVPTSTAKGVIDQLRKYGRTRRGWLGVRIQQVTGQIAENLGLDDTSGALVASVSEGSPAEKGNIQARDVILNFDGKKVDEMKSLPRIVAETEIGKAVDVDVWRDGKKVTTQVTVGELNEEVATLGGEGGSENDGLKKELEIPALGVKLSGISGDTRKMFKLKSGQKGVVITSVDPNGAAAEQQIKPGDVILEVDQSEAQSPDEVEKRIKAAIEKGRKSVLLLMERQSGIGFVAIRITEKKK